MATVGLVAAGLVGFVVGGFVYAIVGLTVFGADASTESLGRLGAVMLIGAVAVSVAAAAAVLARWVVPRVAGQDGVLLPVAQARALVVVAALITGVLVALTSLDGEVGLALGWTIGVTGSGMAGAFLGARGAAGHT